MYDNFIVCIYIYLFSDIYFCRVEIHLCMILNLTFSMRKSNQSRLLSYPDEHVCTRIFCLDIN